MLITSIMTQPKLTPFILLAVVSMSEYEIFLSFVIAGSASLYRNKYVMGPDPFLPRQSPNFNLELGMCLGYMILDS